jgi:hypothetical protein
MLTATRTDFLVGDLVVRVDAEGKPVGELVTIRGVDTKVVPMGTTLHTAPSGEINGNDVTYIQLDEDDDLLATGTLPRQFVRLVKRGRY